MSATLISVDPLATLERAARLMRDEDVRALSVVRGHEIAGINTDRDIAVRGVVENKDSMFRACIGHMTREVHHCQADDDIEHVIHQMARYQVRRLPVMDGDGQPAGMIAPGDIALRQEDAVSFVLSEIRERSAWEQSSDMTIRIVPPQ